MLNRRKKIKKPNDMEGERYIISEYTRNKQNFNSQSDQLEPIQPSKPKDDPLAASNARIRQALEGPDITDAEGLRRAYESPNNTYIYKSVLYIAGSKTWTGDMVENVKYIGIPNIRYGLEHYSEQLAGLAALALGAEAAVPIIAGIETASTLNKAQMGDKVKESTEPQIESLTRFKDAETAYLANRNIITRGVGDSSGAAVLEQLKEKYPEIESGMAYGNPRVDIFGRAALKGIFQNMRTFRNAIYDDGWQHVPAKFISNKVQDIAEEALGLNNFKSTNETGITEVRAAGDPIAALNNSAVTIVPSISDVLQNKTLTHSYNLTASQFSTSTGAKGYANGFENQDGSFSLRQ